MGGASCFGAGSDVTLHSKWVPFFIILAASGLTENTQFSSQNNKFRYIEIHVKC